MWIFYEYHALQHLKWDMNIGLHDHLCYENIS